MWRAPTILVVAVLVLMAIGIVMLASAGSADVSADIGVGGQTSSQHFLQKQFFWLAVAIMAGAATAVLIDYRWWRKLAIPLAVITVLALAAVFVPHIGCRINGARRWAQLGPIRGQPSEIAKFAVIVALAS
ncbi:MAG: FtsW/RodA/SpoVE family cell cycle protein, partial [bacterium]